MLIYHFKTVVILMADYFRFHRRNYQTAETISQYVVEFRRLASTYELGTFINKTCRDCLVCDLSCESTEKQLLEKKDDYFLKQWTLLWSWNLLTVLTLL